MSKLLQAACSPDMIRDAQPDSFEQTTRESSEPPAKTRITRPSFASNSLPTLNSFTGLNSKSIEKQSLNRSRLIDQELAAENERLKEAERVTKNILLLGPASSGKTTFIKQMQLLHGNGFSMAERLRFRGIIYYNLFSGTMSLFTDHFDLLLERMENASLKGRLKTVLPELKMIWQDTRAEAKGFIECLPENLVQILQALKCDPTLTNLFQEKSKFHKVHAFQYFFLNRLDDVLQSGWSPNDDDILNARFETMAINQYEFQIRKVNYIFWDVSGQKRRRIKWMHFFEKTHSYLYFAPIGDYNLNLDESPETNCMHDCLSLFDALANHPALQKQSCILFLNKCDLLQERLPIYPLRDYLPYYTGDNSEKDARHFIKDLFKKRWGDKVNVRLYAHYSKAIDRKSMEFVIKSVCDTLLQQAVTNLGLA